jgi:hypothetical protein
VPFFAILLWRLPNLGSILAVLLIILNMILNIHYTMKYDLKMGMLNVHNYYFLGTIIAKPWVHTQCLGQAMILMNIYRSI